MHLLKTDGRLYLMEDPDQCLYTRDDFEIKESVIITCNDNYRSPQSICEVINAFGLSSSPISTRNPYKGEFPEFHLFSDEKSLISKTEIAIESLIAKGFSLQDIVVLTAKGRVKSKVLSREKIGKFNITKFSGIYTPDGDPKWSSGDLKAETVYRFKGQSSPAIVLTEIDFEEMTNLERNKMFVGITRAQMAVEIVLSVNTESWFSKKLSTI